MTLTVPDVFLCRNLVCRNSFNGVQITLSSQVSSRDATNWTLSVGANPFFAVFAYQTTNIVICWNVWYLMGQQFASEPSFRYNPQKICIDQYLLFECFNVVGLDKLDVVASTRIPKRTICNPWQTFGTYSFPNDRR
jgi:hypothetical protein